MSVNSWNLDIVIANDLGRGWRHADVHDKVGLHGFAAGRVLKRFSVRAGSYLSCWGSD